MDEAVKTFDAEEVEVIKRDSYNQGYINGSKDMITMIFKTLGELGTQVQDLEAKLMATLDNPVETVETPAEE